MEDIQIAVRLKTPDPQATTALNAIKAMRLQLPPIKLHRYDLWEFAVSEGGRETVSELIGHFTDIVNPNKESWCFPRDESDLPGEDPELNWVGVVVKDSENSTSANWTALVKRRGFAVEAVNSSVLWRFGYLEGTDEALMKKMALDLSVSNTRTGGLLSNPVFQEVSFWT